MKKVIILLILSFLSLSFNWESYEFNKLNGKSITYKEILRGSEKTVVFLWASLCWACRVELLRNNDCTLTPKDIKFYYVNLGESKRSVERFAERLQLKTCIKKNIILDERGALAHKFNTMIIPSIIFLKNGEIIHRSNFLTEALIKKVFEDE